MSVDGATSDKNQRSLSYLLNVYKLYQGHINTMFNFFLLTSGLLANAYIQVLQKQAVLGLLVACFGVLAISVPAWRVIFAHIFCKP